MNRTFCFRPGDEPTRRSASLIVKTLLIAGVITPWSGPVHAAFKCTAEDGSVSFQQSPCQSPRQDAAQHAGPTVTPLVQLNTVLELEPATPLPVAQVPITEPAYAPQEATPEGLIPLAALHNDDLLAVSDALTAGAEINGVYPLAITAEGTALSVAMASNAVQVFEFLLRRGADVNKRAHDNQSPLERAAASGSVNLMEKLVRHGARVNASQGNRALYLAAQRGHVDAVAYLLAEGADPKVDLNLLWDKLTASLAADAAATAFADTNQEAMVESLKDITQLLLSHSEKVKNSLSATGD